MKKHTFFPVIFLLLIAETFISCNGKKASKNSDELVSFQNDMEYVNWINTNTLSRDFAHSGKYSSKLDSIFEYSFGYSDYIKNISDTIPRTIKIGCWVMMPQKGTSCQLVVCIDSLGKTTFWQGVELKDSIQNAHQWEEIMTNIKLPKTLSPENKISVYLWNNTKSLIYVDDLKIIFEK